LYGEMMSQKVVCKIRRINPNCNEDKITNAVRIDVKKRQVEFGSLISAKTTIERC
jgi:hypothetical protein